MTVLYADVYFIINFSADYLLLMTCSRLVGRKFSYLRTVFACIVGSVYALLTAYLCVDGFLGVLCNLAISVAMCRICTEKCPRKTLFRFVTYFYVLSFLLGGVLSAFSNMLVSVSSRINITVPLPLLLLICSMFCVAFIVIGKKSFSKLYMKKIKIEIQIMGKKGEMHLLCDTGNLAIDPYSGKYVIIVKKSSLVRIFGNCICDIEKDFLRGNVSNLLKLHLIPIKTAVGDGLMTTFSPQKLFVVTDTYKTEIDACIAIDASDENSYCATDGVVPFALVCDML